MKLSFITQEVCCHTITHVRIISVTTYYCVPHCFFRVNLQIAQKEIMIRLFIETFFCITSHRVTVRCEKTAH